MLTGSSIVTSISLSGLPGWLAIVTAAGSLFGLAALRSTAFLWRGERNAEKAKAERLTLELAAATVEHEKTVHLLEVSEKRPDVEKLYVFLQAHDERSQKQAGETTAAFAAVTAALAEVTSSLAANTSALQLWATEQAQRFNN